MPVSPPALLKGFGVQECFLRHILSVHRNATITRIPKVLRHATNAISRNVGPLQTEYIALKNRWRRLFVDPLDGHLTLGIPYVIGADTWTENTLVRIREVRCVATVSPRSDIMIERVFGIIDNVAHKDGFTGFIHRKSQLRNLGIESATFISGLKMRHRVDFHRPCKA